MASVVHVVFERPVDDLDERVRHQGVGRLDGPFVEENGGFPARGCCWSASDGFVAPQRIDVTPRIGYTAILLRRAVAFRGRSWCLLGQSGTALAIPKSTRRSFAILSNMTLEGFMSRKTIGGLWHADRVNTFASLKWPIQHGCPVGAFLVIDEVSFQVLPVNKCHHQ